MKILLLGGTGEGKALARALHERGERVIYSEKGVGRPADLPCSIRRGGFGGVEGLVRFLIENGIERMIDATHPYAAQISHHAAQAAARTGCSLWALRRPPWRAGLLDRWHTAANWAVARAALASYRRPFVALGASVLADLQVPPHQHWFVRCLHGSHEAVNITVLNDVGPFDLAAERNLLRDFEVDVLVAKNSGGRAVAAKLIVARELGLPVIMLARPKLPALAKEFSSVEELVCHF